MSGVFHVSTRDHSALILMSALASRFDEGVFVSLRDIAEEMSLSLGYLEEVALKLKQAGLIVGKQGPSGGYCLVRKPKDISVDDILTALAGPVALVDCQSGTCPVSHKCSSKSVWNRLQQTIQKSLKATTLESIV
jgi:Rrf2 family protein